MASALAAVSLQVCRPAGVIEVSVSARTARWAEIDHEPGWEPAALQEWRSYRATVARKNREHRENEIPFTDLGLDPDGVRVAKPAAPAPQHAPKTPDPSEGDGFATPAQASLFRAANAERLLIREGPGVFPLERGILLPQEGARCWPPWSWMGAWER